MICSFILVNFYGTCQFIRICAVLQLHHCMMCCCLNGYSACTRKFTLWREKSVKTTENAMWQYPQTVRVFRQVNQNKLCIWWHFSNIRNILIFCLNSSSNAVVSLFFTWGCKAKHLSSTYSMSYRDFYRGGFKKNTRLNVMR